MSALRILLLGFTITLALPQAAFGQDSAVGEEPSDALASDADGSPAAQSPAFQEWWELHPRPSDGWRLGLLSLARTHQNSWAIPVGIVGAMGLSTLIVGAGLLNSSAFFGGEEPLFIGLVTLGLTAAMAGGGFPALTSISRALRRFDDPTRLHGYLKRTRRSLGIASVVLGVSGLVAGLMAPFTFGVSGIPSAVLTSAGVMLGQASLTFLLFEMKVARFTNPESSLDRFGRLPRNPAPPRIVALSPLGMRLAF